MRHLLVIGAQRCGTTWLQKALAAHPEIAMARPSAPEPKVFLTDERSALGREWYERTYFGHATDERIRGEKSTSYLEDVRCADRAMAVLPRPAGHRAAARPGEAGGVALGVQQRQRL